MRERNPQTPMEIERSRETAHALLSSGSLGANTERGYLWSSGIRAPLYTDCRIVLSHPMERSVVAHGLINVIRDSGTDAVAGVSQAGIAWAAFVAWELRIPLIYVRSQVKDHGRENLIEGQVVPGQDYAIIDDLFSSGGSAIDAAKAVREAGGKASEALSIMTYGLRQADDNFKANDLTHQSLTDIQTVIQLLKDDPNEYPLVSAVEMEVAQAWLKDRSTWQPSK